MKLNLYVKNTLLILVLFSNIKMFSQDFELRKTPAIKSEIIYKDGTSEKGFLWIASSILYPRLKANEKGKSKKIDYKKIDKIITNPETENKRVFQYLKHNYNKFLIFVELISSDKISIYIKSNPDLFYSDFDRTTIKEKLHGIESKQETVTLSNGKKMSIQTRYSYFNSINSNFGSDFQYYLLKEGSNKLMKVEKNKRFFKKAKDFFKNCPSLKEDMEQKKITLDDLPAFIEYYKDKCIDKNKD